MKNWALSVILILLVPVICSVFACSSVKPKPAYIENAGAHPKYPTAAYITGVGISKQSREDAEMNSKSRVAEQVRSSINALSESNVSEISGKGVSETQRNEFSQKIKQEAEFSHAELIKIDKKSYYENEGVFFAFAFLYRQEAAEVIGMDYKNAAEPFRAAAKTATDPQSDFGQFSMAFKKMHENFLKLIVLASEYRAVKGSSLGDFNSDAALFQEASKTAEQKAMSLHINIIVEADNKNSADIIKEVIAKALSKMGLSSSPSDICGRSLALRFKLTEECKRGMVGETCSLSLKGGVEDCNLKKNIRNIELAGFKGTHPSDTEKAREKMYNQFTEKKVGTILKYKINDLLPAH